MGKSTRFTGGTEPVSPCRNSRTRAFDDLAAYYYGVKNVTGNEGPEQVMTGYLTANMFNLLEVEAAIGRTFAPGEDGPGGAVVVVLRHGSGNVAMAATLGSSARRSFSTASPTR